MSTAIDLLDAHDPQKPYAHEGFGLMGAVFEVHNELGGGLLEEIYQESLGIEFELRGIPFIPHQELNLFYKGRRLIKRYIPDFVVYSQIVVEIKAMKQIVPDHEAQLLNYMRITRKPVGYLINLGPIAKVEFKRFILSEFLPTA